MGKNEKKNMKAINHLLHMPYSQVNFSEMVEKY